MTPLFAWIIGIAATVTALSVLWHKALKPGARVISQTERAIPVMQALVETFGKDPAIFDVLHEIASEFRANKGSTLRDVVDRMERKLNEQAERDVVLEANLKEATVSGQVIAEQLKINVAAVRILAESDRARVSEMMVLLGKVSANIDVSQVLGQATADDLAASHARADKHVDADPGSAADAFSKTPTETAGE